MRVFFICKDSELKHVKKKKKSLFLSHNNKREVRNIGPEIKVLKFKRLLHRVFSLV